MGKTFISPEVFIKVKTLEKVELSPAKIAEIVGCSEISVTRIGKADTYEAYKEMRRATRLAYLAKRQAEKVTPEDIAEVEKEIEPIVKEADDNYLLTRIALASERQADALERLADAWEREPVEYMVEEKMANDQPGNDLQKSAYERLVEIEETKAKKKGFFG